MGFKKFEKKGGKSHRGSTIGPRLSLRKSGSIGLNYPATKEYFEGKDHLELYNDAVNQRIAFHPLEEETENSYKVRKSDREGHGSQITCKAFLTEYDIIPDKTTRYKIEWDDEQELAVVSLTNPDQVYASSQ